MRSGSKTGNPKLGISPEGTLLEFTADLDSDFGFAYERFLNFEKAEHAHDRFVFCAARGSCRFEVTELSSGKKFTNSNSTTVFKAPKSAHSIRCSQMVYENLVFIPTEKRMRQAFDEAGYTEKEWRFLSRGIRELQRSNWFDSLVERYFTKRVFAPSDSRSLRVLENEILLEVLEMALLPLRESGNQLKSGEAPGVLRRAIEHIELSLFSKLSLEDIADNVGMSRAALLRAFQKDLKVSPMVYVRRRRMEEAQRLLVKGQQSVTEVSYLVGYEDLSAFSRAYKVHFGVSPAGIKAR